MCKIIESIYISSSENLSVQKKWLNAKYLAIKQASTTEKGKFGETFTNTLLNKIGIDSEIINGGIGDFDLILKQSNIKLEHKLATEDVHDSFQFNALDKNKKYDYVFCLGISPNEIFFEIYPKSQIKTLTTKMTKADGGYKLTTRKHNMLPLTIANLKKKMSEIIDG
jgi:hypothetical protein